MPTNILNTNSIGQDYDANTLTISGSYGCSTQATNVYFTNDNSILLVFRATKYIVIQFNINFIATSIYMRRLDAGQWTNWSKVI